MTKTCNRQNVLIANRGEVVIRIAKSLKKMGLKSVGIVCNDIIAHYPYSLDEKIHLDLNAYNSIFTDAKHLIALALKYNCMAIHPGWGFLAENHQFASLCEENGLIFIGPKPQSIADFADKSKAKQLAEKAGLKILKSIDESSFETHQDFIKAVEGLKFPIILKPALGGGGKGMGIVHHKNDLHDAVASSKRIAKQSFANDILLAETYLDHARHIEVQVFSNGKKSYHFGSRDCTMQRRHQKVIEESSSAFLSEAQNLSLCEQAVKLVEHSGYESLGTVEFILDAQQNAYFMEMNTRLQVEHGVTELVYDLDLVELQIKHALGILDQVPQKPARGHAIEVRLYAENTLKTFMPASGQILDVYFSELIDRLDSDLCIGSTIGHNFDPMMAKLLVWDVDRHRAIEKMQTVLAKSYLLGVEHNMNFLQWTLDHADFKQGTHHIQWMEEHMDQFISHERNHINQLPLYQTYIAFKHEQAGLDHNLWYTLSVANYLPQNNLMQYALENAFGELIPVNIDDAETEQFKQTQIYEQHSQVYMHIDQSHISLKLRQRGQAHKDVAQKNACFAPLNGVVKSLHVAKGQPVQAHQVLLSIEAMKMEYKILAPKNGVVQKLHISLGQQVKEEQCLLELDR